MLSFSISTQAGTKTINFAWDQANLDMPNLKEWHLKYSLVSGGPYTVLAVVPYGGVILTPYTGSGTVTAIPDGQKATVYFVCTAVGTSGVESGNSNEVSAMLDFTTVTVPVNFKIVITN